MARRSGFLATVVQLQREADRDRERRARAAAKAQRDASRTAAAHARATAADQRLSARLYADSRAQEAAEDTAHVDHQIEVLQGVLAATLEVDDYLDLEALKMPPRYPVFDPRVVGPPPAPPDPGNFAVDGPSGLGRVFGGSKHAALVEQRQAEYQQAFNGFRVAAQQHAQRLDSAQSQHNAEIARRAEEHRQQVEEISALQRDLAARQPEAVVRYLDLVMQVANYPADFPHSWRLSYAAVSGHLDIDYELPQADVVPNIKAYKYVKSSDIITTSARPAAQMRSLYAEVLRQTALRVVHEVLESDRGRAVRTVVFNGHVHDTDPATGRQVRRCVLALATSRDRFMDIDLAHVDTAECLAHLEARISKDPGKLVAVEPIELAGSLAADYTLDAEAEPTSDAYAPEPGPSVRDDVPLLEQTTERRELFAGQNVSIEEAQVRVDLLASQTDLSVLLVGGNGHVGRDEDFVFYNNPRSADGAVTLTANSASITTALLSERCERVVLVVSAGDGDVMADATAVLHQQESGIEYRFRPAGLGGVSALVWGEIYLRNGKWRLRAVGQGWSDGLAGVARDYGVNID